MALRWPDIFFKARSVPSSTRKTQPAKANAPKPEFKEKPQPEDLKAVKQPEKPSSPAKTEEVSKIPPSAPKSVEKKAEVVLSSQPAEEKKTNSVPESEAKSSIPALEKEKISAVPKTETPVPPKSDKANGTAPPPSRNPGFKRKTRLADIARIILPSKRPGPVTPPAATIIPPAFPVSVEAGSVLQSKEAEKQLPSEAKPVEASPATPPEKTSPSEAADKKPEPSPSPAPGEPSKPTLELQATESSSPREKREFHLANGERIIGHVLSETPDAIYLEHATLGVLTLPRTQIAKRLVELILINGDRIVGDVVAETPECLFVRHASLGMLTVPQNQRSTRVVEAILKDGDRILGEVQAETDSFTIIRSATLGTVTVKHSQIAMLNRKLEQIQLKSLPPSASELKDKPSA